LSFYSVFEMSVTGQFSAVTFTERARVEHLVVTRWESPCCLNNLSETWCLQIWCQSRHRDKEICNFL